MKKALELQPDPYQSYELLILFYLSCGEHEKAIEQSQAYPSKFPGNRGAIAFAARAELFSGHDEMALEYYQKIKEIEGSLVSLRISPECNLSNSGIFIRK